jgi:hypothetical protein
MSQEKKNSIEIEINGLLHEISAKPLTFFDVQAAAPLLMSGTMDFSDYWRHAFSHWLNYTNPDGQFIEIDIESLSPDDGKKLTSLLPDPSEVMEWLVFRPAKSDKSSSSSTGDQ